MSNFRIFIKSLSKSNKVLLVVITDFIAIFSIWYLLNYSAEALRIFVINIGSNGGRYLEPGSIKSFILAYSLSLSYLLISGFYRSRIGSYESKLTLLRSIFGSLIFGISYSFFIFMIDRHTGLPLYIYLFISIANFIILYSTLNIIRDLASFILYTKDIRQNSKDVLIYGAGAAGLQLLNTIKDDININIVGLFDDSKKLRGSEIAGFRVYGKKKHLKYLKLKYPTLVVYLAIPSLANEYRHKIISNLEKLKLAVKTMPGFHDLISNDKKLAEMQDLSLDDILPRESSLAINFDFKDQSVLITGAGGSIGSELARQVIKGNPKKIVLFDISEFNLYKIQSEIENILSHGKYKISLVAILGDVKNKNRVKEIIIRHSVDTIYHSAAYKHVPIVEYSENIFEGIQNNIFGTQSVCSSANETCVSKVVLISTDKAVRPANVMGATKRVAEMIAQSYNSEQNETNFCMVRFGNVINSSGSVIPLFMQQIRDGGPLTITHKDVTRFFMTIPEAANLVMQAGELSKGGEVFILNMGKQVKIYELAKRLIHLSGRNIANDNDQDGIQISEVGLRPGEKLYEELLISGNEDITDNKKILIVNENFPDKNLLQNKLTKLIAASKTHNVSSAIDILESMVEGYVQENKILK